jgi:hypothetical protein
MRDREVADAMVRSEGTKIVEAIARVMLAFAG